VTGLEAVEQEQYGYTHFNTIRKRLERITPMN